MGKKSGQYLISFVDSEREAVSLAQDNIFIGRLDTCEVVLDHSTVSRIHAGINFTGSRYELVNLSSSNALTVNGRQLRPQQNDVLAAGDMIQIGPYVLSVGKTGDGLSITVQGRNAESVNPSSAQTAPQTAPSDAADVLKVFWEKRSREKEDWGTRLRPTERPQPGKAMFNWRPTRDLRRSWRFGLFVWALLMIGAAGAYAYFNYPGVYAPKSLSNPHVRDLQESNIAAAPNRNSCTTCHTPNEPLENSCVNCHQAQEFHASNTRAHEEAGVTCTVCHREHQGADFQMVDTAIRSCAECHNDNNSQVFDGKTVRTAHDGSYGYPVDNGQWKWNGVYREVADAIPEINSSATGDKSEEARLSRQFHTVHVYRLKTPEGMTGDSRGLVSCSTCHKSFDPIDRITPRETCAACHTTPGGAAERDPRFGESPVNCISCHVQHPYSSQRWKEFLTEDALDRRTQAVRNQIEGLGNQ